MKESSSKSKIFLDPINPSQFEKNKAINNNTALQSSINNGQRSNNLAELYDWSKPSSIINPNQGGDNIKNSSGVIQNHSMDTEQLLKSDKDKDLEEKKGQQELEDSDLFEELSEMVEQEAQSLNKSYLMNVFSNNQVLPHNEVYMNYSEQELEQELKSMREQIITMNLRLNKLLDRYELLGGYKSKDIYIHDPHAFITKQIHNNHKLILKQQYDIKKIEQQDQELEKKDYLVQLEEIIIEIKKQIHDLEKEKHGQQVTAEKVDKALKEFKELQDDDQYKDVKILKHYIVFYFKKLTEQTAEEELLENELKELKDRDEKITKKLHSFAKVATEKCLEVTTNRTYLELKKKSEQFSSIVDTGKKKNEVLIKSQAIFQEKIHREIILMHKELDLTEKNILQHDDKNRQLDYITNELINRHKIDSKQIKPISYRFAESLLCTPGKDKDHIKMKPDFKRIQSRMDHQNTIDSAYSFDDSHKINKKDSSFNDKNISLNAENEEQYLKSVKPNLKLSSQKYSIDKRYPREYENSHQKYQTIESNSIFRPNRFIKTKK